MYDFARLVVICFGGTLLLHGLMHLYETDIGPVGFSYQVIMLMFAFALGFIYDMHAVRAGLLVSIAHGVILFMNENQVDGDVGSLLYLYVCVAGFISTVIAIIGSRVRAMFPRT